MDKGEDPYKDGLKAANYKMALQALKAAREALARTDRTDLAEKVKKVGKDIITDAFRTLPKELYGQLAKACKEEQ